MSTINKNSSLKEHEDGTIEIDFQAMQEGAECERKERGEQFKQRLKTIGTHEKKEQEAINGLFAKAILSEREEKEVNRTKEIETEKAKAVAEVEAKFESKGVKSEKTKKLDDAYNSLLNNLPD